MNKLDLYPDDKPDKRDMIRFFYDGKRRTIREISKLTKLSYHCLYARLCGRNKHLWVGDKAFTTPALKKAKRWTRDEIIEHLRKTREAEVR